MTKILLSELIVNDSNVTYLKTCEREEIKAEINQRIERVSNGIESFKKDLTIQTSSRMVLTKNLTEILAGKKKRLSELESLKNQKDILTTDLSRSESVLQKGIVAIETEQKNLLDERDKIYDSLSKLKNKKREIFESRNWLFTTIKTIWNRIISREKIKTNENSLKNEIKLLEECKSKISQSCGKVIKLYDSIEMNLLQKNEIEVLEKSIKALELTKHSDETFREIAKKIDDLNETIAETTQNLASNQDKQAELAEALKFLEQFPVIQKKLNELTLKIKNNCDRIGQINENVKIKQETRNAINKGSISQSTGSVTLKTLTDEIKKLEKKKLSENEVSCIEQEIIDCNKQISEGNALCSRILMEIANAKTLTASNSIRFSSLGDDDDVFFSDDEESDEEYFEIDEEIEISPNPRIDIPTDIPKTLDSSFITTTSNVNEIAKILQTITLTDLPTDRSSQRVEPIVDAMEKLSPVSQMRYDLLKGGFLGSVIEKLVNKKLYSWEKNIDGTFAAELSESVTFVNSQILYETRVYNFYSYVQGIVPTKMKLKFDSVTKTITFVEGLPSVNVATSGTKYAHFAEIKSIQFDDDGNLTFEYKVSVNPIVRIFLKAIGAESAEFNSSKTGIKYYDFDTLLKSCEWGSYS